MILVSNHTHRIELLGSLLLEDVFSIKIAGLNTSNTVYVVNGS